jgi:hypothetical protein
MKYVLYKHVERLYSLYKYNVHLTFPMQSDENPFKAVLKKARQNALPAPSPAAAGSEDNKEQDNVNADDTVGILCSEEESSAILKQGITCIQVVSAVFTSPAIRKVLFHSNADTIDEVTFDKFLEVFFFFHCLSTTMPSGDISQTQTQTQFIKFIVNYWS